MRVRGEFAPETEAEVRERRERLGSAARVVVKETAKAMGLDREQYRERVTPEVVETARDALFASLLEVRVGTREEFEAAIEGGEREVIEVGSENVDSVAWHVAPFADTVVAATFHEETDAAVATLRRQAYGRVYRPLLEGA